MVMTLRKPQRQRVVLADLSAWDSQPASLYEFSGESDLGYMPIIDFRTLSLPQWADVFDREDQAEFEVELMTALEAEDPAVMSRVLSDWRTTAEALSDPLSRELLLTASHDPSEYVETSRPA